MTTTHYDDIAHDYQKSKFAPWRIHIERHTLFSLVGELKGKSVLDMACGDGIYSRESCRRGASRVVGVDLSQGMIDLARAHEAAQPQGLEFHVHNVATVHLNEKFDVVLASYLFNYAQTADTLEAMTRSVARHLKPGGRLVAVNNHPGQSHAAFDRTRKYGVSKSAPMPIREGTPITYTIFQDSGPFTIENYHLSLATHHRAFTTAGMNQLAWRPPSVSTQGQKDFDPGYWDDFLKDPPIVFIEAVRP